MTMRARFALGATSIALSELLNRRFPSILRGPQTRSLRVMGRKVAAVGHEGARSQWDEWKALQATALSLVLLFADGASSLAAMPAAGPGPAATEEAYLDNPDLDFEVRLGALKNTLCSICG
jgi:hypothetical protein